MAAIERSDIIIREATHSDNEELLNLTSLTPMKGSISIRIDRRPDFFRLLELRGSSVVIVAELNNKLIGSYSASAVNVFIDGKLETVYYLGDFKVHPDYRKTTLAIRLVKAMKHKLESLDAELLFCTVAHGNDLVAPFFTGRAFLPVFDSVGIFNVYQIIPTPFKTKNTRYRLEEGPFELSYLSLFNNFMQKFQLGHIFTENSFENTTLLTTSFNDKLVAAIALIDISFAKQNVLIRLSFYLKCIVKLLGLLNIVVPIIRMPKTGEDVKILYVKSFAFESGHKEALQVLLARARRIAWEKEYTFLSIGIHEKDPDSKLFSGYPHFLFRSMGMITSLKGRKDQINSILKGIVFEDYSLV